MTKGRGRCDRPAQGLSSQVLSEHPVSPISFFPSSFEHILPVGNLWELPGEADSLLDPSPALW